MMKIYAIIVTYNGIKWIEKCLSSLISSSIPLHIIVIDNASTDNTVAFIKQRFPEVELILSEKNLGFGGANNIGLKKALNQIADYVFLLNQDAWIENDTVEKLVNIAEKNKNYGILSPFHLNWEGTGTEVFFEQWVLEYYTKDLKKDLQDKSPLKSSYTTEFIHAACWLLPISTIQEIGGFDPLYFHYGEDNDFIQRTKFKGFALGIVPSSKVYHEGVNEGLKHPKKNIPFLINEGVLLFKNPRASDVGALILFFKQFLKIHLKGFKHPLSRAYQHNLRRLFKMMKSRNHQKLRSAYLQ